MYITVLKLIGKSSQLLIQIGQGRFLLMTAKSFSLLSLGVSRKDLVHGVRMIFAGLAGTKSSCPSNAKATVRHQCGIDSFPVELWLRTIWPSAIYPVKSGMVGFIVFRHRRGLESG